MYRLTHQKYPFLPPGMMRSAPDWAALPTSGAKQLSSCPGVCGGLLVDAAGRPVSEGPASVLPDAAAGLAAAAGVHALEAAAGVLADCSLASLLDAAAEISAVLGMLAASAAAAWGFSGVSGGASAPLSVGACDAAVPASAAAAAGQEDCTCSAVQPGMLSCTLMSLNTCRVSSSGQHSGCKLCYPPFVWLQDYIFMTYLEKGRLKDSTVECLSYLQSQTIARRTGLQGVTCRVGVLFTPKASANMPFPLEISLGASYAAASVSTNPM